jgi:hypothetical protein
LDRFYITAFDAHINLQPTSEEPVFQSIQAQPDISPAQRVPSPTPRLASSEPYVDHSLQNKQTALTYLISNMENMNIK